MGIPERHRNRESDTDGFSQTEMEALPQVVIVYASIKILRVQNKADTSGGISLSHYWVFNGRTSHRLLRPHLRKCLRSSLQIVEFHTLYY